MTEQKNSRTCVQTDWYSKKTLWFDIASRCFNANPKLLREPAGDNFWYRNRWVEHTPNHLIFYVEKGPSEIFKFILSPDLEQKILSWTLKPVLKCVIPESPFTNYKNFLPSLCNPLMKSHWKKEWWASRQLKHTWCSVQFVIVRDLMFFPVQVNRLIPKDSIFSWIVNIID